MCEWKGTPTFKVILLLLLFIFFQQQINSFVLLLVWMILSRFVVLQPTLSFLHVLFHYCPFLMFYYIILHYCPFLMFYCIIDSINLFTHQLISFIISITNQSLSFKMQILTLFLDYMQQSYPFLAYLCLLLGIPILLRFIFNIVYGFYGVFVRKRINLIKRYGTNSWALITGSSEGIGKEIALELAKEQFNIILVARTESKLKIAQKQIKEAYPSVQVIYVIADLQKQADKESKDEILSELQRIVDLDISMVINNAGVDIIDDYEQLQVNEIIGLIKLNCCIVGALSFKFIPVFEDRVAKTAKKCLIANVSSIAGEAPLAYQNVYSASKGYVNYLTKALTLEYPTIDFITLRPGEVSTRMTYFKPSRMETLNAKQCATGFVDDIGYQKETNGHWVHKVLSFILWLFPSIFDLIWTRILGRQFIRVAKDYAKKHPLQK